jgi:hypothetical protein
MWTQDIPVCIATRGIPLLCIPSLHPARRIGVLFLYIKEHREAIGAVRVVLCRLYIGCFVLNCSRGVVVCRGLVHAVLLLLGRSFGCFRVCVTNLMHSLIPTLTHTVSQIQRDCVCVLHTMDLHVHVQAQAFGIE